MLQLPDQPGEAHYLEVVRQPDIASVVASALANRRTAPVEVELDREPRAARHGQRRARRARARAAARCSCCTTSPTCVTPIRSGATSSPTSRTNCARRSRPFAATWRRCSTRRPTHRRRGEFLEVIARHTLRMERLVRDLLRLARLDAGQETIERASCPIDGLIDGRDARPRAAARRPSASASSRSSIADAATVTGDPAKLQDVLRNLIENASNYSPDGGQIDVATRRTAPYVEIAVADRGPGIPDGRPAAHLRALLSRGSLAVARSRRHRPRAVDRQASGRTARRHGRGGATGTAAARSSRCGCRTGPGRRVADGPGTLRRSMIAPRLPPVVPR